LTEVTVKSALPKASRYDIRDDQNIGLVLRVAPTGRKTWSLSYRNREGRQQRYTLGIWPNVKLARARQLATEKLGEVAGGQDIAAERKDERRKGGIPTLKAFVQGEYGDWIKAHHKSTGHTLHRLERVLPWQDKRLDRITVRMVEAWQTKRAKDGVAPSTIQRDIATLNSLLSKAVSWGHLDGHPLKSMQRIKRPDNTVIRYLDKGEEERLLTALRVKTTPDYLRVMVVLAMNTGLRRGELLKLSWSSVDLKRKILTVTAASAKSSKTRHVPLNSKALDVLKAWRKKGSSGAVFGLTDVKKSWATLLDLAEIENFRFHDLRHHFASKLAMAGIDLNTIRELLGHSDIRMTLRYSHLAPAHKAAAVEVL
jgi:integrase